jgi:predicted component of type VI protein secretion system
VNKTSAISNPANTFRERIRSSNSHAGAIVPITLGREHENYLKEEKAASPWRKIAIARIDLCRGFERYGLWLLKNPSFLPNSQNLGDTKCAESMTGLCCVSEMQ